MSVTLLLSEVQNHKDPHLVLVSSTLHFELDAADELVMVHVPVTMPNDPQYGAAIDECLRMLGHDPNKAVNFHTYKLRQFPNVNVQLGGNYGRKLLPSGPGSFEIT